MATAEATTVTVATIERVTLHMSHDEARTLWAVMMKVGGSPTASPRKHVDAIRAAIADAVDLGDVYDSTDVPEGRLVRGSAGIHFSDYLDHQ